MRHQFHGFTLDSERRCLALQGRELPLQPKAFDLLVYLVENRDRVVPKSELLEAVWPGVVVSEGSLKRAANLVRSALRAGGANGLLRNYPRQGYRFCDETAVSEPVTGAASALDAGLLERRGRAAHQAGNVGEAAETLQRALTAYEAADDARGAARCALHLAHLHFDHVQLRVGRGWLARAHRLLPLTEVSPEHGHAAWLESRYCTAEGHLERALELADEAHAVGRALGDPNLEALGLLYRGLARVALGQGAEAVVEHDEAAAAVLAPGVQPWVGGLVYCGVIFTCRNRADWQRAREWTDRFQALCDEVGDRAFPGTCGLHRAEVLHMTGQLGAAMHEATRVCETIRARAPWAEGEAQHILGDLLFTRGDLDGAEAAYVRAYQLGWEPQPGLARLQLARGNAAAAVKSLQRALDASDWYTRQRRGMLLTQLCLVAIEDGAIDTARRALADLERAPELWPTPALSAGVAEARAALARAEGRGAVAIAELRRATRLYRTAESHHDASRVRLVLAEALLADGDREGAILEANAAAAWIEGADVEPLLRALEQLQKRLANTAR